MPVFIAALLGGLVEIVSSVVGRALVSLGIGYAVFTGVNTSIDWAKAQVVEKIGGLSGDVLQFVGVLQVGTCISIITSAYAARLLLNGLTGDSIKRMIQK